MCTYFLASVLIRRPSGDIYWKLWRIFNIYHSDGTCNVCLCLTRALLCKSAYQKEVSAVTFWRVLGGLPFTLRVFKTSSDICCKPSEKSHSCWLCSLVNEWQLRATKVLHVLGKVCVIRFKGLTVDSNEVISYINS